MYRGIVICDNDGTLLPFGETALAPYVEQLISRLIENGYLFVVASGRPYMSLIDLYAGFKDDIAFIGSNGAAIYYKGEMLYGPTYLAASAAQGLMEDITAHPDFDFVVNTESAMFMYEGQHAGRTMSNVTADDRVKYISSPAEVSGDILQICARAGECAESFARQLDEKWGKELNVFPAGYGIIDLTPNNKGTALKQVATHFGIPLELSIAIGDSHNDLPMLKAAGTSYLMDIASEELRAQFPLTCGHVSEVFEPLLTAE